jgi:hypothetical protein
MELEETAGSRNQHPLLAAIWASSPTTRLFIWTIDSAAM